jgi:hypothetical protein
MNVTKSAVAVVLLGIGFAGMSRAHAATCATTDACFEFVGGSSAVNGGLGVPTGSWFSMLVIDTNSDGIPDQNVYTAMRSAGGTDIPGPNGFLNFSEINTLNVGGGAYTGTSYYHNSGNMIDRDWSFYGVWGAHYTNQVLEVTGTGDTRSVNMAGWTAGWNGSNMNVGAGGPAIIDNFDGIWGNGNDTLDYSAVVPMGDSSGFGGANYALHMVGSCNPVPLPAAVWLLGSGLIGLTGVARRPRRWRPK